MHVLRCFHKLTHFVMYGCGDDADAAAAGSGGGGSSCLLIHFFLLLLILFSICDCDVVCKLLWELLTLK